MKMLRITILSIVICLSLLFLTNAVSADRPLELDYPEVMGEQLGAGASLPDLIRYLFLFSLILSALIAVASLAYGGFVYIISTGKPNVTADAHKQMTAGILGLIILFCSWLILYTINPDLLNLQMPGKQTFQPYQPAPLSEQAKKIREVDEIPIGVLINSEYEYQGNITGFYSQYQGILHPDRIERLEKVSEMADRAMGELSPDKPGLLPLMRDLQVESKELMRLAKILQGHAEQLKIEAEKCKCSECNSSCSCSSSCSPCSGDTCPTRNKMNQLRNAIKDIDTPAIREQEPIVEEKARKVELFAQALEAFIEKNNKVEDFIKDNQEDINKFFSEEVNIQKLIYEMKDLENVNGCDWYESCPEKWTNEPNPVTKKLSGRVKGKEQLWCCPPPNQLSDKSLFATPDYTHIKYEPEKEENDVEKNKEYLYNALERLIMAENKIQKCSMDTGDLTGHNDFHEWVANQLFEIEIAHWKEEEKDILPTLENSDPSTLYCSEKYGPAVILVREGGYVEEIPIGETVDMAEDLAEKILLHITNINDKGVSATDNSFLAVDAARHQIDEAEEEIIDAIGS